SGIEEKGDLYLQIQLDTVEPKGTEDLKMIKNKLGGFTTNYTGASTEGRVINMKIAASKINGTILYPGEVFSTNEKFGPTTQANGYKPAKTIIDGKFVDEFGGGVCQISSTLYNAVLYSELEIVERRNHSLKVGYLDYGYDATLAGNYIDLKFKNSTKYPIYIESYLTNNQVICNIYGYDERPQNREIKFQNALVQKIEPGPRVVKETDTLPEGEEKVEVKPLTGYKYKLYKLVYQDGKLTDKILVNDSYYRPRAEEVLVGTNPNGANPANANNDETISTQTEATSIKQEIITETTTQNTIENTTESIIETTTEITTIQTEENVIETESTENLETTQNAEAN
ncbi:MAG: VanW family protein, partial [Eubacteriales bacterium]|nr:VanW family protein [Eubacteriales bacterium]